MKTVLANLGALAVGALSLAATVGLLVGFERLTDFDLFSLMWWFVIPAGAFITGLLAASGYYFGAVRLDVRPSGAVGLAMFALAAAAQVALYYARYWMAVADDGTPARALVEFLPFTLQSVGHAQYGLVLHGAHFGATEIGWLAYGVALLQFAALIAAGWAVFFALGQKPYCTECARYLRSVRKTAFGFDGDLRTVEELRQLTPNSRQFFEALQKRAGKQAALELELTRCPACAREALIERPMFSQGGKPLAYEGGAYRTSWTQRGEESLEPQLVALSGT